MRIAVTLVVSAVILIPGIWIITIQLALYQKGCVVLGIIALTWGFLSLIGALDAVYFNDAPREWLFGYFAVAGVSSAAGSYLISYRKWIYGLELHLVKLMSSSIISNDQETANDNVSSEMRQVVVRLAIFSIIVALALLVTGILSALPQFGKEPYYLTIGFFGTMVAGMVISGLIREESIADWVPWSRKKGAKDD